MHLLWHFDNLKENKSVVLLLWRQKLTSVAQTGKKQTNLHPLREITVQALNLARGPFPQPASLRFQSLNEYTSAVLPTL